MAADATLVQGAREAHSYFKGGVDKARNEMFNQLNSNIQNAAAKKQAAAAEEQVKQEKLNKKANSEAEALEKQKLQLEKQWEKQTIGNANSILASDADMSSENYSALYDDINGDLKNQYINGSPKEKALALKELNKRTQQVDGIKQYSTDNAELLVNMNQSGKPFNPDGYSLALQDDAFVNERNVLGGHTSKNSFNIAGAVSYTHLTLPTKA